MTEIYLIRHTQAEGNRFRMIQGFWDGEVSRQGYRQIEALAERFADIPVDAVYASDLSRAVLTAEAIARHSRPQGQRAAGTECRTLGAAVFRKHHVRKPRSCRTIPL